MNGSHVSSNCSTRTGQEAREWIVRLESGAVDATCLAEFKAWRDQSPENARAYEQERNFWADLEGLQHASMRQSPVQNTNQNVNRRGFLIGGFALASAASVAGLVPVAIDRFRTDYATSVGERSDVKLPDGSRVAINTNSAIAFAMTDHDRQVTLLRGEAEFSVAQDNKMPLVVRALNGTSSALNGIFTIKQLDDEVSVTVTQGETLVRSTHKDISIDILLAVNQQAVYGNEISPRHVMNANIDQALAWKSGRIIFDKSSFNTAISDLERYIPERVILAPGVERDTRVSGTFNTNQAYGAINALAQLQGRTTTRLPGIALLIS